MEATLAKDSLLSKFSKHTVLEFSGGAERLAPSVCCPCLSTVANYAGLGSSSSQSLGETSGYTRSSFALEDTPSVGYILPHTSVTVLDVRGSHWPVAVGAVSSLAMVVGVLCNSIRSCRGDIITCRESLCGC